MGKYERYLKQYVDMQAAKASAETEIKTLEKEQERLAEQAQQAAEAGDVSGYMDLKRKKEECEAVLYVKQQINKKPFPYVDRDEMQAAWSEYVKPINNTFRKKKEEYKKARHDLFVKFQDIISLQNSTFQARENCVRMTCKDLVFLSGEAQAYNMEKFTLDEVEADLDMFVQNDDYTGEEAGRIKDMLSSQVSAAE